MNGEIISLADASVPSTWTSASASLTKRFRTVTCDLSEYRQAISWLTHLHEGVVVTALGTMGGRIHARSCTEGDLEPPERGSTISLRFPDSEPAIPIHGEHIWLYGAEARE